LEGLPPLERAAPRRSIRSGEPGNFFTSIFAAW
jgi:hypothetical protein